MEDITQQFKCLTRRKAAFMIILVVVLFGVAFAALTRGPASMGFKGSSEALLGGSGPAHAIIWKLRLPRIVMAVLAGAGLALAGTVFQAILRNPLASPYTLGIASSAGFGAVMAIVFGAGFCTEVHIAGSAFIFALISSFLSSE